MRTNELKGQGIPLADNGQCQVDYSADADAVQVRVGETSLRLPPSAFLAVCATLLKAARALGEQSYIPELAPRTRSGVQ